MQILNLNEFTGLFTSVFRSSLLIVNVFIVLYVSLVWKQCFRGCRVLLPFLFFVFPSQQSRLHRGCSLIVTLQTGVTFPPFRWLITWLEMRYPRQKIHVSRLMCCQHVSIYPYHYTAHIQGTFLRLDGWISSKNCRSFRLHCYWNAMTKTAWLWSFIVVFLGVVGGIKCQTSKPMLNN